MGQGCPAGGGVAAGALQFVAGQQAGWDGDVQRGSGVVGLGDGKGAGVDTIKACEQGGHRGGGQPTGPMPAFGCRGGGGRHRCFIRRSLRRA